MGESFCHNWVNWVKKPEDTDIILFCFTKECVYRSTKKILFSSLKRPFQTLPDDPLSDLFSSQKCTENVGQQLFGLFVVLQPSR